MRTFVLTLGALAAGLATAHEYPNCESDNCYRNLVDERFADKAVAFCPEFLSGTTTAADAIPTEFNNCDGNVKAVSSACSCITYSASSTEVPQPTTTKTPEETTSTEVPEETTSSEVPEETSTESPELPTTTTEAPETTTEEPEECTTDEPEWTTSTITISTTRTITQCPSSVSECPNGHTTVTTDIIVTTTVCPVTSTETDEPEQPTPTGSFISSHSWGTVTHPTTTGPRPTSTLPVTGAAPRFGVEGVAAVAGIVAAFL